jgi:hypothetical protein
VDLFDRERGEAGAGAGYMGFQRGSACLGIVRVGVCATKLTRKSGEGHEKDDKLTVSFEDSCSEL